MQIVLNTYGTLLNRDNEAFVVTNDQGKRRIPTDGVTSIMLTRGTSLTSDAVMLAIEHEIEIHFADRQGNVQGMVWSHKYGSVSTIRKGQLEFCRSARAVQWIKGIIARKLQNQQAMLLMIETHDPVEAEFIAAASAKIGQCADRLQAVNGDTVGDVAKPLRGLEGTASRIYFEALNWGIPLLYRFGERSQHPARDIANAMLNYGYGMLYAKVESALVRAGIDPYLGVLHRDEYNRPVLVYDMIEPYRVWVDYVVVTLLAQQVVTDDYYSTDEAGAVWLEAMGRRVLVQSLNDYMEEVVKMNGISRSRDTHIFLEAQALAQRLKASKDS
ncbi:MAG: CRISPR-associated endonuclease Cas1 [Muribaculaceae bacterium]|nr:CRISPR-associated endonuclease Cas1 [Muribaculaceae bacterium]